jgi:hypothetical protein
MKVTWSLTGKAQKTQAAVEKEKKKRAY